MISSLCIANRGEIAVRIIRTCKEMGIRTVLAHSEADRHSLAATMADEKICIGPSDVQKSYLNQSALISAALLADCDAIHPGVGFLSENADFCQRVLDAGIMFVGPKPHVLKVLGNKFLSRQIAQRYGIPLLSGSGKAVNNVAECMQEAKKIGMPIILKASAGGGGKGMRVVYNVDHISELFPIVQKETMQAFKDKDIYIEKYLESPRHVEVQLLADNTGKVIDLGERDCTVQQCHQKLLEESPAPHFYKDHRQSMCDDAKKLFTSLGYEGLGTVEFLYDGKQYYFMEVNARVQVEHPITEMCYNLDLIKLQLQIHGGEEIPFTQDEVECRGYALECRINAQEPGTVHTYVPPGGHGVRVDSFLVPGVSITPFYDALVAKVIVYAENRMQGIEKMLRALNEYVIEGIKTNISLQKEIIGSTVFKSGRFSTHMVDELQESQV